MENTVVKPAKEISDNWPYQCLFEPLKIGPVTAPNRFYQVPHCTGMGYRYPRAEATIRGIKAEGGWGVVSTQETEIHPSSDLSPANEGRLWSDEDIPALKLMTEAVHSHGSLAAIQLVHNGLHTSNRYSRMSPLAPSHACVDVDDPVQAVGMSKRDIKSFRQWHLAAARRAKEAGFDIVYVYAGHDMTLLQQFLLRRHNHRSDEYGGSLSNRIRLFREVIEETKDAIGDTCAVAVRLAVEELMGADGIEYNDEGKAIIQALAEEPDLWDVNLSDWSNDSQSARFSTEGYQEPYTGMVKSLTTKPVVGVGRYTSPDTMRRLILQGVYDFVGAARPSIADPFLPAKIRENRLIDIRECIGCNICITGDNTNVPMRCTQNPSVGEEWRRGWHPEKLHLLKSRDHYLIVGGGAAGLEAARVLGERGAEVTLAEANTEWGGRVLQESALPGLASWARVKDWRLSRIEQLPNVSMHLGNDLSTQDVLSLSIPNVVLATGAWWRNDGVGRVHRQPLEYLNQQSVISPSTILSKGTEAVSTDSEIVVFDDDRFYLASAMAELFAIKGYKVTYVSPAPVVAAWSANTLEQSRIQARLMQLDVTLKLSHKLADFKENRLSLCCCYSGRLIHITCDCVIPVTSRLPDETLWHELNCPQSGREASGITSVNQIGDCKVPGLIASAVSSGYEFGVQLSSDRTLWRREDRQFC